MGRHLKYLVCIGLLLALVGCHRSGQDGAGGQASAEPVNCDGHDPWVENGPYKDGDRVQNLMRTQNGGPGDGEIHLFQCLVSGWCNQGSLYEPGKDHFWDDATNPAWRDMGLCSNENSLIVTFPAAVAEPPPPPEGRTPPPARAAKATPLTGRLQCGAEEFPVSGSLGGAAVTVTGMKKGRCVLIMDAAADAWPMNTPMVFDYPDDKGYAPTYALKYRRSHDPAQLLTLPGMQMEIFAAGLDQPRQMALNKDGTVLFVGSSAIRYWIENKRFANVIYALQLDPGSGRPTKTYVLDAGLEEPHGVAYRDGDLYYSTVGALYRIKNVDAVYRDGLVAEREKLLDYPADDSRLRLNKDELDGVREQHQKHPLYFNPLDPDDPYLYTAVGTPCNVCKVPGDDRYGSVLRFNLQDHSYTLLAKGVRNASAFDWNPADAKIWFTDHNRQASNVDVLENNDELNVIDDPTTARDFGAPHVFGRTVPGYTAREWAERGNHGRLFMPRGAVLGDRAPGEISARSYIAPVHLFQPSSAPIGVRFWHRHPGEGGDQNLLVALHGAGLQVMMATIRGSQALSVVPAVSGWLLKPGGNDPMCLGEEFCMGRPTDLMEMPDGSILLSNDVTGVIYRLRYSPDGLPATSVSVRMPAAPVTAVAKELIPVTLIDPDGRRRNMDVAWNGVLKLDGLAHGDYQLELGRSAAGDWVPQSKRHPFTLSAAEPSFDLAPTYIPRPTDLAVPLRLTAPARPDGALADSWVVTVTPDKGQARRVEVPWGGSGEITLNYGSHEIRYPYTEKAYPQLQRESVEVDEDGPGFDRTTSYMPVDNLGRHMLVDGDCKRCHTMDFWQHDVDPFKWDAAGIDALKNKIMSMRVDGHCDGVCAGEIGQYLLTDVWGDRLGGGDEVGPRQLRLLARQEYVATVKDLLDVEVGRDVLPPDQVSDDKFLYVAEARAGVLAKDRVRKFYAASVDLSGQLNEAALHTRYGSSAEDFVANLGRMMFRRSLSPAEKSRYVALYQRPEEGGVPTVVLSMLASPYFLYRSELGVAEPGRAGVFALTGPERATALAYNLWGTTPDSALLDLAESDGLQTPEAMQATAEQMLADPRAARQMARFISYFIGVSPDTTVSVKDGLSQEVVDAMRGEIDQTVIDIFGGDDVSDATEASVYRIFNPGFTYLSTALASHYGLSGGGAGGSLVKVPLTGDNLHRRGGPLNSGLFPVAYSGETATSIITRGFRIRQHMYCQVFQGNADRGSDGVIPTSHAISERQKWDIITGQAAADGKCWTCHKFFNDTGASLENYDALGKYQLSKKAVNQGFTSQDVPIVASGPFISSTDGVWIENMRDVRDIALDVPANEHSLNCLAQGYYRFVTGTRMDGDSYAAVKRMTSTLMADNSRFKKMIAMTMASGAMLQRRQPRGPEDAR